MSDVFTGDWRIIQCDLCNANDRDMLGPAMIRIGKDGLGSFNVVVISAGIDCRYATRDGKAIVEFTFDGDDDGHPCTGRGWATIHDE